MESFDRIILCASGDVLVFVVAAVLSEILIVEPMSTPARRATQFVSSFVE